MSCLTDFFYFILKENKYKEEFNMKTNFPKKR